MKKRIKLIAMCLIIIMLFCNYFIPIAYAAENLTEDGKNNTEEITENTVENEEVEEEAKEEDVTKEEEKPEEVTTEETTTEEVIVEEKKTEEATKDNENLTESNGNQVEQENKEPEENNTENVEANSKVRAITKSSTNSETDEEVVFADDKLKGYLLENYDANEDGKITQSDMAQITELEIPFFVYKGPIETTFSKASLDNSS